MIHWELESWMKAITIGLVQMRCEKGAIDDNLAKIYAHLQDGCHHSADIMCFPEMSITGYIDPINRST